MKTMKWLVMMMVLLVASLTWAAGGGGMTPIPTTVGALPTNMWMITSTKALESYAKEQVSFAVAYGYSAGVVLPGGKTWSQAATNDPDIRVIHQLLGQDKMSFQVADPLVDQYFYAFLSDSAGYTLFSGGNIYQLVQDAKGNWQMPPGASTISNMVMSSWTIPIHISGVQSAYVVVTDMNGQKHWEYLTVQNDRILFRPSLAGLADQGWSGQMVMTVGNGSAVYDMNSGTNLPTVNIDAAVQASIKGLVPLDDPAWILSTPQSTNGQGENPLYQVKITQAKKIGLYGITSEGEAATGVFVRKVGEINPVYYPLVGQIVYVQFDVGVSDVWFKYPHAFPDTPYL